MGARRQTVLIMQLVEQVGPFSICSGRFGELLMMQCADPNTLPAPSRLRQLGQSLSLSLSPSVSFINPNPSFHFVLWSLKGLNCISSFFVVLLVSLLNRTSLCATRGKAYWVSDMPLGYARWSCVVVQRARDITAGNVSPTKWEQPFDQPYKITPNNTLLYRAFTTVNYRRTRWPMSRVLLSLYRQIKQKQTLQNTQVFYVSTGLYGVEAVFTCTQTSHQLQGHNTWKPLFQGVGVIITEHTRMSFFKYDF